MFVWYKHGPLWCSGEKTGFKIAMQPFSKDNIFTVVKNIYFLLPIKLVTATSVSSLVAMLIDIYFCLATKILNTQTYMHTVYVYTYTICINAILYSCSFLAVHYMQSSNEIKQTDKQ